MPVAGYASTTYALPGSNVNFHLSASTAGTTEVRIDEIGGARPPDGRFSLSLASQAVPAASAWEGFGWPVSKTFVVPAAWRSGLYRLHAKGPDDAPTPEHPDGFRPVLDFAVRPASVGARLLLLADFITPQAYNGAGGKSLYDGATPKADRVSFDRPTDLHWADAALVQWLRGQGIAFDCTSMVELHANPSLLAPYACVVFGNHCEYWSKPMRDQVEAFVRKGGSVVSLSGNTCYRQVRFESGTRKLVCYKYAKNDPNLDATTQTVAFAQPPVHRPPNAMLGSGWTHGAWGGAMTAYRVHFPTHWVFQGTGLGAGSSTAAFMGYETDAAEFAWEAEGHPRVTGAEETPLSTVVLASADLGHWTGKPGMATMTLYARHGRVFAAGTTEWIGALHDPTLGRITRNVLARLCDPPVFDWEHVGHANGATAMCPLENKLFLTTADSRLWRRHPVLADAAWARLGHANGVIAMAGAMGLLFAATADGLLRCRSPVEADVAWAHVGSAPPGVRAMGAVGSTLYAVDQGGRLHSRPARPAPASWRPVPSVPANATIQALASYNGVLFAATSTNRLLRTNFDFVEESLAWIDLYHCNGAKGLAVVDGMLFAATSENKLWWLDLRHAALDARSGRS